MFKTKVRLNVQNQYIKLAVGTFSMFYQEGEKNLEVKMFQTIYSTIIPNIFQGFHSKMKSKKLQKVLFKI